MEQIQTVDSADLRGADSDRSMDKGLTMVYTHTVYTNLSDA